MTPYVLTDASGVLVALGVAEDPLEQLQGAASAAYALPAYPGVLDPSLVMIDPLTGEWAAVGGYGGSLPGGTPELVEP